MTAYLILGSSFLMSGHQPVAPGTQVNPGVADKYGPGAHVVLPTTEPAPEFGTVLGVMLAPGVIPP